MFVAEWAAVLVEACEGVVGYLFECGLGGECCGEEFLLGGYFFLAELLS